MRTRHRPTGSTRFGHPPQSQRNFDTDSKTRSSRASESEAGQWLAVDDGLRIVDDQIFSNLFAGQLGDCPTGLREYWPATLGIVSIAGDHVNGALLEQPLGDRLRLVSPESGNRIGGHLYESAGIN